MLLYECVSESMCARVCERERERVCVCERERECVKRVHWSVALSSLFNGKATEMNETESKNRSFPKPGKKIVVPTFQPSSNRALSRIAQIQIQKFSFQSV